MVEARGGVVQEIYTDLDAEVVLIDWDNVNEGDEPGLYRHHPLSALPVDTHEQVTQARGRRDA